MATEEEGFESQEIFMKPMCIIYSMNGTFHYNVDVLEQIEKIDKPLVVVAIAGLYRTGKSYLMNRLAGRSKGFPLGSTIESKTKGIWVWCRKHPQIKDTVLLLLDTEGLGDVEKGDPGHDNRIFTLAVLLCNVLVYNMMTAFNNDAVEKLTFISEMSANIHFTNKTSNSKTTDLLGMVLPKFVLCLRDFTLDLEKQGKEITADEYLEDSLQIKPGKSEDIARYNRPRESIKKYFPERKCFTFDMPGSRKVIKELEKLQLDDLSETFVEETNAFLRYVYQQKPKVLLHSKPVTGTMFVPLVKTYVNAIKNGAVPDVDDAISVVANIENQRMANVAVEVFRKFIEEVDLPILQIEKFEKKRQLLQNKALEKFRLEAVFNSEKFEIKAIDEMNKIWEEVKNKNVCLVEEHCRSELEQIYNTFVGEKMQRKEYHKANGHSEYKENIDEFKTAYKRKLKGTDDVISQKVLNFFLEDESQNENLIMMADKKLSEEDRRRETERINKEHMEAQRQQQITFEQNMCEERKRAEENSQRMEKEREEYRKQQAEHLKIITEQYEKQRERSEKQIEMMKEENKIIREENKKIIADMNKAFEKKNQEMQENFQKSQEIWLSKVEQKDRELKELVEQSKMQLATERSIAAEQMKTEREEMEKRMTGLVEKLEKSKSKLSQERFAELERKHEQTIERMHLESRLEKERENVSRVRERALALEEKNKELSKYVNKEKEKEEDKGKTGNKEKNVAVTTPQNTTKK